MGDFNYGGTYVAKKDMGNLEIDSPPFVALLRNKGTTVKHQPKGLPYDRIYYVPHDSVDVLEVKGDVDKDRCGLDEAKVSHYL